MAAETPDLEVKMDMTPMIDMVFQLVMFFIIAIDFSRHDIALLTLPPSTAGAEDKGEDPRRIVINVTAPRPSAAELADPAVAKEWPRARLDAANKILVRQKEFTFEQLLSYLKLRGVAARPDPKNPKVADVGVLIRCDGKQAFDLVKGILQICANPAVAIYKVEIATAELRPGER